MLFYTSLLTMKLAVAFATVHRNLKFTVKFGALSLSGSPPNIFYFGWQYSNYVCAVVQLAR
jgi:hypothetical protein